MNVDAYICQKFRGSLHSTQRIAVVVDIKNPRADRLTTSIHLEDPIDPRISSDRIARRLGLDCEKSLFVHYPYPHSLSPSNPQKNKNTWSFYWRRGRHTLLQEEVEDS